MEDRRTLKQWGKSEISYQNYTSYLKRKANKFDLSIVGLFYIKNFKGGLATFNEHEDVIKENLIPKHLSKKQISYVYANEADILNMALFGMMAKQWRD